MSVEQPKEIKLSVEAIGSGGGDFPYYTGSYAVIPKIKEQKLATKNKSLVDDVTIFQIPYAEVSNPAGGKTITIGLE